jgi:hypothetical protein
VVDKKTKTPYKKLVYKTEVFYGIGHTSKKGKDNDAQFHFPFLCKITEFFISSCSRNNIAKKDMVLFLLTDGCRAQYRGCKAFEFYSQLNEKYGVCFVHMLGIPHKFKGPHDSFGFVFKDKMNRIILSLPENFTGTLQVYNPVATNPSSSSGHGIVSCLRPSGPSRRFDRDVEHRIQLHRYLLEEQKNGCDRRCVFCVLC